MSPPPGVSVGLNRAAHRLDESARHRQAKADTAGVVAVTEPLESFEQLLLGATRNTRSLIDDVDQDPVAHPSRIDSNRAVGRIPQGVVDQVRQHAFEQSGCRPSRPRR